MTGVFFDEQSVEAIIAAEERARAISWRPLEIANYARNFSTAVFEKQMALHINQLLKPVAGTISRAVEPVRVRATAQAQAALDVAAQ